MMLYPKNSVDSVGQSCVTYNIGEFDQKVLIEALYLELTCNQKTES